MQSILVATPVQNKDANQNVPIDVDMEEDSKENIRALLNRQNDIDVS